MTSQTCRLIVATLTLIGLLMAGSKVVAADSPHSVTFIEDVRPILETSCVKCHGENEVRGDLQVDRKDWFLKGGQDGPVAIAGNARKSLLIERVSLPPDDKHVMPHKGPHLTAQQIETLSKWIDAGMHWPDGLVLRDRSSKGSSVVATGNGRQRYNLGRNLAPASPAVLDQLIQEDNRTRQGLVYGQPISELAYLRKVTVDLVGRIPTDDEIRDYLGRPAGQRRRDAVEALLKNSRLADRWTAFYADMIQIRTRAPGGPQLLQYVRRSIENGKPYDEMARELIAASGAPNASPAVGFILGHNANPMVLAGATAQNLLGVRLACAECHDHPFDKWSQKQFYDFAGWFGRTKHVEHDKSDGYIQETDTISVRWPPEGKAPDSQRHSVEPDFLFDLESFSNPPPFLVRFEQLRRLRNAKVEKQKTEADFDGKLDNLLTDQEKPAPVMTGANADLEAKAREESSRWLQPGVVRTALAERLTSPRNRYFTRAFVNRVWAELLGRGFYEPVDDFRDDTLVSHPRALEYLADEFVAGGYDLATLLRIIVNSETYQRGHLGATVGELARQQSTAAFVAAPWRRIPAESLYDSLAVAGHLFDYKWPAGANIKQVEEHVAYKVTLDPGEKSTSRMTNAPPPDKMLKMLAHERAGFDLEDAAVLGTAADSGKLTAMLDTVRQEGMQDLIEQKKQPQSLPTKEMYKTETRTIDDNPKFGSAYRTESPAPIAHFLRVFGQPARERLGDFRDQTPSLRQELMMINGRLTHEASRVGPYEPLYPLLAGTPPQPEKAIRQAYLGALTREPSPEELTDALAILHDSTSLVDGMADLRWALFNCDEFRYLP